MGLNNGAVNEILPFCTQGIESQNVHGELLSLSEYKKVVERLRGHQPGIAKRAVENRALRQALHMGAGVAQFIANRYPKGVVDDADLDKVEKGLEQSFKILGSYEAEPDTFALRNKKGQTQTADPEHDLDAVNLRTAKKLVEEVGGSVGGFYVKRPAITSPQNDATDVSLDCTIYSTELALSAGTARPKYSQYRVRAAGGVIVFDSGQIPYSTSCGVDLPDVLTRYEIDVRHNDEIFGWSDWSQAVVVTSSSKGLLRPRVVSPARNAVGVALTGLTLKVTALESKGVAASPSASRFILSKNPSMANPVKDSGEIAYSTTYKPGTLEVDTTYYWQAQHKHATEGWTGLSVVSAFTTQKASAPNTSGLTHSFPGGMNHGTQANAKIWGAKSTDGTPTTYKINAISYGLSFSKTSGITDNETIVIGASAASPVYTASFHIFAMSASGAEAAPVTVSVTVVQPISASYLNPGNYSWTCPVTGYYQVIVGGGGGSGRAPQMTTVNGVWGGSGGGCAIHNAVYLTAGVTYNITVGDSGETTSFHGIIYATGGVTWNQPGQGFGGQINTAGGLGGGPATGGIFGGGGGAGTSNGGNGGSAANMVSQADGGASGGGSGGSDGITVARGCGGLAGYGGGGGGAQSIPISGNVMNAVGRGGHGCCYLNWVNF